MDKDKNKLTIAANRLSRMAREKGQYAARGPAHTPELRLKIAEATADKVALEFAAEMLEGIRELL